MKILIGILVGLLLLSGVAMGTTTDFFFIRGSVATNELTSLLITNEAGVINVSNAITVHNDSATTEAYIYIDWNGLRTIAEITGEASGGGDILFGGEEVTLNDHRTIRLRLLASTESTTGTTPYRVRAIF